MLSMRSSSSWRNTCSLVYGNGSKMQTMVFSMWFVAQLMSQLGMVKDSKGSLPFKQWDLGGCSLVRGSVHLNWRPLAKMLLSLTNIVLTSTFMTRLILMGE
jgi:hypothetical protein